MTSHRSTATLRTVGDLDAHGLIQRDQVADLERVAAHFSVAITPSIMETIATADPNGAVARQYVPSVDELTSTPEELDDPIGDAAHSPLKGIIRRYSDRVLLNVLQNCAVYCRFCFRRENVGQSLKALSDAEVETALDYVRGTPEIWEVILSGGDPLMLPAKRLRDLANKIAAIDHVGTLRVHTRVPVAAPERITDDMLKALRVKAPTWVVIHVNHRDELTDEVRSGIARLADAGIPLLSQSVLLKGINDDADVLTSLFKALITLRVKPYYLHHPDKARGTAHFRTTLAEGQDIVRAMRGNVSGLCQPTYVLDIPGGHGKVPVGPAYVARTVEGSIVTDPKGSEHTYIDEPQRDA